MRSLFLLLLSTAALAAPPEYRVTARVPIDGPTRWDLAFVDTATHQLYVANGSQTDVLDTGHDALIGRLEDTHGVHAIAVAAELGLVFTSNGADNEIGVYDISTRKRVRTIKAGTNPDAIVYEPVTRRVIAFNGRSRDLTIAQAATGEVVAASVPVGGKPELAVADGRGFVYFNIDDTAEIATLDARAGKLVSRYSLAPCEGPTGLDIDPHGRLYSACDNGLMVVSDPATGKVIGQASIGAGPDGLVWMDGYAISANGRDGTASVVGETSPGHFETVATVTVARGARTIAADRVLHKLFLPTADFKPQTPALPGQKPQRPEAIAGTFKIIVLSVSTAQGGR